MAGLDIHFLPNLGSIPLMASKCRAVSVCPPSAAAPPFLFFNAIYLRMSIDIRQRRLIWPKFLPTQIFMGNDFKLGHSCSMSGLLISISCYSSPPPRVINPAANLSSPFLPYPTTYYMIIH